MPTEFTLTPLATSDWSDEISDMRGGFAGNLNVYRTMAHHPGLLRAWADLRDHIVNCTALGPQRAEVVILRSAYRLGSDYEWSQHILRARGHELPDWRISALRGPIADLSGEDGVLAGAVDDLLTDARLSADTKTALARMVGPKGILDLMATVGFYSTLGFILNSFQTPQDEGISQKLAANPLVA